MIQNILNALDPVTIIKTVGLVGMLFIVFAESGLFFGFFLPGDSLLFTAGFLASQNYLNVIVLVWLSFLCAVLGDSTGYWFGQKVGPKIFKKEDSFFFHKRHIERAEKFYEEHGNKTIFLARFIPIVRTFAPIVAGVGRMRYSNFITYNIIGGFVWSFATVYMGYFLGEVVPNPDRYLLPILFVIIIISFLPVISEFYKSKKKRTK